MSAAPARESDTLGAWPSELEAQDSVPLNSGVCPHYWSVYANEILWTAKEPRQRVADVLTSDEIPDPRDVALLSLLDACEILPDIFPGKEIEDYRQRLALLRKMDLIGREVAGAIAEIGPSIIQAVRARAAQFKKLLLILSRARPDRCRAPEAGVDQLLEHAATIVPGAAPEPVVDEEATSEKPDSDRRST